MGIAPDVALGAARLSLGRATTRDELVTAVELLARLREARHHKPTAEHGRELRHLRPRVVPNDPP